jgi:hypothetical protein
MKRQAILFAVFGLCLGSVTWASQKVQKKANFSGTWVLKKVKNSASPGSQPGRGGGMRRGGGYPGGGYPGGRTGGGGGQGGGRQGGGGAGSIPGIGAPTEDSQLVIDHTDSALKVTHKSSSSEGGREYTETFLLDGSESVNPGFSGGGEMRSRTSWDNNKLVTLGTQQMSRSGGAASDVVIKQEFSLSKDGKTLTFKTSRTANGRSVSSEETFERQTDAAK